MTFYQAQKSLDKSFDFATVRPEKARELAEQICEVAGHRSVMLTVARSTGPPVHIEVWLEYDDKYVKIVWLKSRDFPDRTVTKEEMVEFRAALDVYFERHDR